MILISVFDNDKILLTKTEPNLISIPSANPVPVIINSYPPYGLPYSGVILLTAIGILVGVNPVESNNPKSSISISGR